MDRRELADRLKQERLKSARPWEPISDGYLTAREFLSLIGVHGKSKAYRRALRVLRIASSRSDLLGQMPEYLTDCFREGIVQVHPFRGTSKGAVAVEYRIPIESLDEKCAALAKRLIPARSSKNPCSVPVSRHAFQGLGLLSAKAGKSKSELVEEWVERELERLFAQEL